MRMVRTSFQAAVAGIGLLGLTACGDSKPQQPAASGPPPAVTVVKAASEDIRPTVSFTGRVEARDKVDLRARVDGFLEKRLFTEGADVKQDELLFVLEKGQYQAAVEQARGALEQAQAALKLADIELARQTELLQKGAGTQARVDDATAKQGQAHGEMLSQKASLDKALLNLSYTDIKAPLAGRIGRAALSVGNFVGPSSNALATIVSQDPIYVTFPVTQREILAIRKQNVGTPDQATIFVQLADGSRYAHPGRINFLDVTVNQGTDTVQVRSSFPNPDRLLVDGQLVSVIAEAGKSETALLVPQQALQFDQAGTYVLVIDNDNKVQVRRIETGDNRGAQVIVRKGLAAGERLVTEGIQRVRPGLTVNATEAGPGPRT